MRTASILTALVLCLIVGLPAVAQAGGVGACIAIADQAAGIPVGEFDIEGGNGTEIAVCIDAVTEGDCALFCGFDTGTETGKGSECFWEEGLTCDDVSVKIPWEGACDAIDSPFGAICGLLATNPPGGAQQICEDSGFVWLGPGSVCGGVPALPKLAYGALALVLLTGTLTLLTLRSRS